LVLIYYSDSNSTASLAPTEDALAIADFGNYSE